MKNENKIVTNNNKLEELTLAYRKLFLVVSSKELLSSLNVNIKKQFSWFTETIKVATHSSRKYDFFPLLNLHKIIAISRTSWITLENSGSEIAYELKLSFFLEV